MNLPEPKALPRDGFERHPWVEKQNAFMDSEAKFKSEDERRDAIAAYWGLCEWMDNNVGLILAAMADAGVEADVIYTSDHGDNVGARGLWGKSNMYSESVSVPLIADVEGITQGTCNTPVSLLDLSRTIPAHFGVSWNGDFPGRPLQEIAVEPGNPDREIISQYHAVDAVSGSYMLRRGRWKYIEYVGFKPELFDLNEDPEELCNLVPARPEVVSELAATLRTHVDAGESGDFFTQQSPVLGSPHPMPPYVA